MTINIVKKVVIFITLAILIVLVAGCSTSKIAAPTTTLAPTTTTESVSLGMAEYRSFWNADTDTKTICDLVNKHGATWAADIVVEKLTNVSSAELAAFYNEECVPVTTTSGAEPVFTPDMFTIEMTVKEMGCDDIGGFYTLVPVLTVPETWVEGSYEGLITYELTGGEFPEIHSVEIIGSKYDADEVLDYGNTCDVVWTAKVTSVTIK